MKTMPKQYQLKNIIILLEWTGRMQHVYTAFSFVWTHKMLRW